MGRASVATDPHSMIMHGHLTHGDREEPRLEPRQSHDLLPHLYDTLEDSVEWSHSFHFTATRSNREEECTSFKMPSPRSNGLGPHSAIHGVRIVFTALEGPWAENYGSGVSGPNELSENALEIE